jgi:hypothetical protein
MFLSLGDDDREGHQTLAEAGSQRRDYYNKIFYI